MVGWSSEIEMVLQRLERSEMFVKTGGLLRLLRFLIEHADSTEGSAKETYIGAVFYGRQGTYDPRYDSIVRVNVKRLRERLIEYYATEGKHELRRIAIPLGTYSAVLETVEAAPRADLVEQEPVAHEGRRSWLSWPLLISIAVCLTLFIVGVRWLKRTSAAPAFVTRNLSPWPLTPGRDIETDPAVSPDGKMLAYVTRKTGAPHFQIFLRPFKAIDQIGSPLDTGSGDALRPAWSPDGRTLAFLHCGIGSCDIETVPATGGMPRSIRVLPRTTFRDDQPYYMNREARPIWTPDGKSLIFPYGDQDTDREALVQHQLATGVEHVLTSGKKSDEEGAAALSPDGTTMAFIRVNLNTADVMTLNLRTLQQAVLVSHWDVHTSGMAWSPDGRGVVLSRQHDARWQPWWVPLHGQPRPLSVNLPVALNPIFATDGHTLMVTSVNRIQNIVMVNEGAPTSAPQVLFRTTQRDIGAKFSPDGSRIAFLSDRSGRNELWVATVGAPTAASFTSQPTQLTHNLPASATITFSWSPDEKSLLVGLHSDLGTMALVDAGTGNWSLLKVKGLEKSLLYCPIWSADGRWIYASASGDRSGIFRIALDGHVPPEPLVEGPTYDLQVDGDRYLYFDSWIGNGISRISLAAQPVGVKPVVEPIPELATVLASRKWVIVGGALYYLDIHDEERRLRRFDLQTHTLTAVTGGLPNIAFAAPTLSVLPDQHIFIYSKWDENTGSQIMELRPE